MNTSELEQVLEKIDCTKNPFGGVYPSDLLPLEVKQYPQSFVANVDTSEYFIDNQHGELFDSHRLPPHRYTKYFEDFLNRNAAQWTYNRKHLQSLFTDVCGHYCIFYIYSCCHNVKTILLLICFHQRSKNLMVP